MSWVDLGPLEAQVDGIIASLQQVTRERDEARLALSEAEAERDRLGRVLDDQAATIHPWYGPRDGFDDGECTECARVLAEVVSLREEVARLRAPPGVDVMEIAQAIRCEDDVLQPALGTWQLKLVARALSQHGAAERDDERTKLFLAGWGPPISRAAEREKVAAAAYEILDEIAVPPSGYIGWGVVANAQERIRALSSPPASVAPVDDLGTTDATRWPHVRDVLVEQNEGLRGKG